MTDLLYQTDSYLREFDAVAWASAGNAVLLDRLAFFPGGGGQMADKGRLRWDLEERTVTGFERRAGTPWVLLDGECWTGSIATA
jgi:misacylated tRNA(Ala) deacylase